MRANPNRKNARVTVMKIRWLRERDEVLFNDPRRARRELGHRAALTLKTIADTIERTQDFRELVQLRRFNMHRLTGDRRHQWALRLTGGLRLIVQPDATYSVTIVIEIVDYH